MINEKKNALTLTYDLEIQFKIIAHSLSNKHYIPV